MISAAQIMNTLQPWVGSGMLPYLDGFVKKLMTKFCAYSGKEDLSSLNSWIEYTLYSGISEITRKSMLILLDNGQTVRMLTDDFPIFSDELLYCLFSSFPHSAAYVDILRDYSLHTESLSALRALYLDFKELISEEERTMISRIIANYPAYRTRNWFI